MVVVIRKDATPAEREAIARTLLAGGRLLPEQSEAPERAQLYLDAEALSEEARRQLRALPGLRALAQAGRETGLPVVTEVMEPGMVETVAEYADILQVGSRNMQNFPLLRAVGQVQRPILLKRGFAATIEEWLLAAEYILL